MRAFSALISALWRYSAGRRWMVITYVTMFVVVGVIYMFEPYVIGLILNGIQESLVNPTQLRSTMTLLLVLVALAVGFWLFHGPARVIERINAFHTRTNFADHLFSIVLSLPVSWHKQHHSGQTINRMRKATRALFDFSENSYQLLEMVLRPLGSLVALTLIMPTAALIAVTVSVIACSLVFAFDRILLPLYERINEEEHFVASALHDYVTNITTVITLRLEKLARSEHWRRLTHYFPIVRKESTINESKWFLATFVISLMTSTVLAWYVYSTVHAGLVPLAGTFFMLYDYLQKIGAAFYTFAWKYSNTVQQYADLSSVDHILAAEVALVHGHGTLSKGWKKVRIEHLDFVYKDEEQREHHLKDISLTLQKGKKIALVGESGAGKSTLMKLIRGLDQPDHAVVTCDGTLLPGGLKDVASSVTLIPQEPEIFANTIEYNITVDTEQSKAELREDIALARFTSVLERLPKGLETDIREKGVNLSGGEKQRLALARGIFAAKQSSIILLDEPTSSVDSKNEVEIYKNIFARFPDRCIVSSIHKLHLLPMFDEVYVFDQGRLVQQGEVKELLMREGMLKGLWEAYKKSDSVDSEQRVSDVTAH